MYPVPLAAQLLPLPLPPSSSLVLAPMDSPQCGLGGAGEAGAPGAGPRSRAFRALCDDLLDGADLQLEQIVGPAQRLPLLHRAARDLAADILGHGEIGSPVRVAGQEPLAASIVVGLALTLTLPRFREEGR